MPAKKTPDEPKDTASEDSSAKIAPASESVKPPPPAHPAKKPLGVKEVIPFEWKLVGVSANLMVTLFKATERAEVDAQCERLRKDGYYQDLQVLPLDENIAQPKAAKNAEITPKSPKPTEKKSPAPAKKVKRPVAVTATMKKAPEKKSEKQATPAKTATSSKRTAASKKKTTSGSKATKAKAKKTTKKAAPTKTKKTAKKTTKKTAAKKTKKAAKKK